LIGLYFGEGAVRLVRETGKPIAQVARDLGINEGTLGNWVNADKRRRSDGSGALDEDERAELARLRKENAELAMERDVLIRITKSPRFEGNPDPVDQDPLEKLSHEYAVRIRLVISEWLAVVEPELLVQLPGGQEELIGACLETEPGESHAFGLGDDVLEQHGCDAAALPRWCRAHRLHFSVARVQPLDRTATDQGVAVHDRPERDLGLAKAVEIEGMLAFRGRRDGLHLLDVLVEERGDPRA
jgi:transposase